ncbi:MAG: DUF560 domain-containing protein [Proteobacteria bacterium]|nr:DUF560 domain-containing protein [Pseudomonadota bacterium]
MTTKRKAAPWRAVLLAAGFSLAALLAAAPAGAQENEDLASLNAQILDHPQDFALNLRYARLAEAQGKLRLALAAYERVLINSPDNIEAQRGYERIRRVIEPSYSSVRLEAGEQWDSNALDLSDHEQSAYTTFVNGSWVDERRFGARRWRTYATFRAELTPEISELNYGYASIQVGPFVDLSPTDAAIPALGVAISSLANTLYFGEVNASVTIEGHRDSATYWGRVRGGYRSYGKDATAEQGFYAELMGGLSLPNIASANDWISVSPWVRWSGIEGSTLNFLNDTIAPGEYSEYGLEATYSYRINDHVSLSLGAMARDRYYSQTEVGGENRHDTYVAPKASVTLWNLVSCSCGLTFSYQYRDNHSNDSLSEYRGRQATISLVRQF